MHSNQVSRHIFRATDRADVVDRDVPSYGRVVHVLGEPPVLGSAPMRKRGRVAVKMTNVSDGSIKVKEAAHVTNRGRTAVIPDGMLRAFIASRSV